MRVCKNTNDDLRMDGSRISREQTSEREGEREREKTQKTSIKKSHETVCMSNIHKEKGEEEEEKKTTTLM